MAKEYVLVFCMRHANSEVYEPEVLLIQKDRPEWQKGKLNLPGGKIEEGETPKQTAIREIMEETGLTASLVKEMGVMGDRDLVIHCLSALVNYYEDLKPREGETEVPIWMNLDEALQDKRLIPNLRAIIPMMRCGVTGWTITDNAAVNYKPAHTFTVTVPTYV